MRFLRTDRTASVVIRGHAFVQNLRRGHYELGVEASEECLRVAAAFDELADAIWSTSGTGSNKHATWSINATVPTYLVRPRRSAGSAWVSIVVCPRVMLTVDRGGQMEKGNSPGTSTEATAGETTAVIADPGGGPSEIAGTNRPPSDMTVTNPDGTTTTAERHSSGDKVVTDRDEEGYLTGQETMSGDRWARSDGGTDFADWTTEDGTEVRRYRDKSGNVSYLAYDADGNMVDFDPNA
jgi:hypothetical protein